MESIWVKVVILPKRVKGAVYPGSSSALSMGMKLRWSVLGKVNETVVLFGTLFLALICMEIKYF